ncbi:Ribulose-phosphate 3-epimerase [hydrothermal vent metagenome]|uniref:ribulose-phosphate 3-epimerase n=1 Tax=hydrothermal vent metagenome TaxID=652676 RepID=A0A3B1DZ82_9ZZZZ
MGKSIKVSASILCADFTKLGEEIKKCEDAGVDMIHIDVMDGHFVPVISIGDLMVKAVRSLTDLPIDVHLMIENPWAQIDKFIEAGSDIISLHAECYGVRRLACQKFGQFPKEVDQIDAQKARKDILKIKEAGKKVFMVLNPGTPMCLDQVLDDLDGVLIMSVNPGFSFQKFMPEVLPKIKDLRENFDGDISIDGGIKAETALEAVKAGANILATASYFFGSKNPKEAVVYLKNLC